MEITFSVDLYDYKDKAIEMVASLYKRGRLSENDAALFRSAEAPNGIVVPEPICLRSQLVDFLQKSSRELSGNPETRLLSEQLALMADLF